MEKRFPMNDEQVIPSIMAEAETAEATEAAAPSLAEAFTEGQNTGLKETPRRRAQREGSETAPTEDSAETEKPRERLSVRHEPTLQEAIYKPRAGGKAARWGASEGNASLLAGRNRRDDCSAVRSDCPSDGCRGSIHGPESLRDSRTHLGSVAGGPVARF